MKVFSLLKLIIPLVTKGIELFTRPKLPQPTKLELEQVQDDIDKIKAWGEKTSKQNWEIVKKGKKDG